MRCYKCGAQLTDHDFCTNCGVEVKQYKKIISVSDFYYNDGLAKAGVRDLSGAIVSLRQCLKLNKFHIDARNLLGLVFFEMGETVDALSEWVISKNLQSEKNIADHYIDEVQNSPSQLETLNQSIKKYNQAITFCRQESYDLAVIQLKRVLSIQPKFLRAHQLLALLYMHSEEWEKARKELVKCGRIDTNNTCTLRYMKEVRKSLNIEGETRGKKKSGKQEDVIKYRSGNETIIQPLNVKEPKKNFDTVIYLGIGLLVGIAASCFLILPAQIQSAKATLNAELRNVGEQLDKKNTDISDLEAQVEALTASKAEVSAQLEAYAGTDGTLQAVEDLLNAAYIYLDTPGETQKIAAALEKIEPETIEAETTSKAYKELYGKLLAVVGPQISQTYYRSGSQTYKSGDYDSAIKSVEQAVTYDENNSDALYMLANAYKKKGDSKNAAATYNLVIERFPNTSNARRSKEALKELEP